MKSRKEIAVEFLQLVIDGRIDEAYKNHVDMTGRHHNTHVEAGFAALRDSMRENHAQFPAKQISVKHVTGEDDVVVVHSRIKLGPEEAELSAVHIFRFREETIAEMWDVVQPVPTDSSNRDGAF
jgi:predicted SnoaL-like aldol condensation-catalyzing enzyme